MKTIKINLKFEIGHYLILQKGIDAFPDMDKAELSQKTSEDVIKLIEALFGLNARNESMRKRYVERILESDSIISLLEKKCKDCFIENAKLKVKIEKLKG